jgi:cyclin B
MLQILDFNIQITSSYRFLERFTKVARVDPLIFNLSRYLLELSLVNYKFLKFSPSNLASSALYLSLKMTKHPNPWNEAMIKHSHYKEQTIRQAAKDLFQLLQEAQSSQLQAVKKKFALPKFCEVSKIRLEHSSSS